MTSSVFMLNTLSSGISGWMVVCEAGWLPVEVIGEPTGAGTESVSGKLCSWRKDSHDGGMYQLSKK